MFSAFGEMSTGCRKATSANVKINYGLTDVTEVGRIWDLRTQKKVSSKPVTNTEQVEGYYRPVITG